MLHLELIWGIAHQAPLSSTIFWSFLRFMSTELVMLSDHLILCRPLLLLPSLFPSIRIFSKDFTSGSQSSGASASSISPSNEYSGLISFRIGCCDFLAVQGTLKSLLQHHNVKASSSMLSPLYGPTLTSVHDC